MGVLFQSSIYSVIYRESNNVLKARRKNKTLSTVVALG